MWTIYAPRGRRTNKWVAAWRRGVENFHNKESATAIIFSGDPPKVFICLNSRDGKKTDNNSWWLQPVPPQVRRRVIYSNGFQYPIIDQLHWHQNITTVNTPPMLDLDSTPYISNPFRNFLKCQPAWHFRKQRFLWNGLLYNYTPTHIFGSL